MTHCHALGVLHRDPPFTIIQDLVRPGIQAYFGATKVFIEIGPKSVLFGS